MVTYVDFCIYSRSAKNYTEVMISNKETDAGTWDQKHKLLRKSWVYKRLTDMIPAGTIHPLTGGRDVYDLLEYIDYINSSNGDIYEN